MKSFRYILLPKLNVASSILAARSKDFNGSRFAVTENLSLTDAGANLLAELMIQSLRWGAWSRKSSTNIFAKAEVKRPPIDPRAEAAPTMESRMRLIWALFVAEFVERSQSAGPSRGVVI
jgi:hypothetical protein